MLGGPGAGGAVILKTNLLLLSAVLIDEERMKAACRGKLEEFAGDRWDGEKKVFNCWNSEKIVQV